MEKGFWPGEKRQKPLFVPFQTPATQATWNMHFHAEVVQWRQRNVQKSVLRVQSCWFAYRKCFIKPGGLVYFIFIWGGWGLLETGSLFERECSFNLEKTVVSVLHKELDYKVENLKYKKLDVMQPRFKNKSKLQLVNKHPLSVHMKFYSCDWFIQTIIC